MERYAERYTNIENYETPRDMLDRLEAKKDGRYDPETNTFTPKNPEDSE